MSQGSETDPTLAVRLLPTGHLIPPAADGRNPAPSGHVGDFDFLVGSWRVRHRCLVRSSWQEFDGECSMRKLFGGQANFDENIWHDSILSKDQSLHQPRVIPAAMVTSAS